MEIALIVTVVVTALAFDFTNGFHDTANAMAGSIATGALKPRMAVALCATLNLVGAFLSIKVAATIAKGVVDATAATPSVVFAGLVGAIAWNLITWYFGLPSSSSHALIGGVVGATFVAAGWGAIKAEGIVSKVLVPALVSPILAGLVAMTGTFLAYRLTGNMQKADRNKSFRVGQIGAACMLSLSHGTNDAQKTMGVITLALISGGFLGASSDPPIWVIISAAVAISLGTYIGGWRVIRTLSKGITEIKAPQGFAADTASSTVILVATHFGFPLSTTHVASGSIIGSGIGRKQARVKWPLVGRMASAWAVTLPASALVGGLVIGGAELIGGAIGVLVMAVIAIAFAVFIYRKSRGRPVNADNVGDDIDNKLEGALVGIGGFEMLPSDAVVKKKKPKNRAKDG